MPIFRDVKTGKFTAGSSAIAKGLGGTTPIVVHQVGVEKKG